MQVIISVKPQKCESRSSSTPKKYVRKCFNHMLEQENKKYLVSPNYIFHIITSSHSVFCLVGCFFNANGIFWVPIDAMVLILSEKKKVLLNTALLLYLISSSNYKYFEKACNVIIIFYLSSLHSFPHYSVDMAWLQWKLEKGGKQKRCLTDIQNKD